MTDIWYTADGDGDEDPGAAIHRYIANHAGVDQVILMRNETPLAEGLYVTNIRCPQCDSEPTITCPNCGYGDD